MFWKIYFWFTFIWALYCYVFTDFFSAKLVIDILVTAFGLLGFFLFAYRKKFLNAAFWKVVFIVNAIWVLIYNYYPNMEYEDLTTGYYGSLQLIGNEILTIAWMVIYYLIFIGILTIPYLVALYLYGFKFLK
jgi:hypothetical protein